MRLSKLMKKMLLTILKADIPDGISVKRMAKMFEKDALRQYGRHESMDTTRRVSYKRALRKLEEWGLVDRPIFRLAYGWQGYRLTDKGKTVATKIRNEILDFISEFADLT